jgi:hypothetical protein
LREQNPAGAAERSTQRMAAFTRWPSWYHLPTGHRQRKHRTLVSVHHNDRRTRTSARTITYPQLTYRLTIVFLSAGISGIGIGETIAKFIGG